MGPKLLMPNNDRSKAAVSLIQIILAIESAGFIIAILKFLIYFSENGIVYYENEYNTLEIIYGYIAILYIIVSVISVITFLRWFYRAYDNLKIATKNTTYSSGWAIGFWFIPIVNLFMPYLVMKDLYVKTDRKLLHENILYRHRLKTNYIGWWWALWIIAWWIGKITLRVGWNAESGVIESFDEHIFTLAESICRIFLCMITIIVIKDYAEAEKMLFEMEENNNSGE